MNRKFLVLALFTALVAAGCGGGSSVAPSPGMNPGMGTVGLQLDVRLPSGVTRKADFLGAGADRISYSVAGSTTVAATTVMLSSCSGTGPVTCSIGLPFGTGYQITLSLLKGATVLGTGTSGTFNLVANSAVPTVGITINPVLSGPTISISPSVLVQDGTTQTLNATLKQLDPNANVVNTSGGSVLNWLTLTTNATGDGGTIVAGQNQATTSPPTTNAGSTAAFTYNGGTLGGTPQGPITFSVTDGAHTGTAQATVAAITLSPLTVTFTALASPTPITVTEYNTTSTTFTPTFSCGSTFGIGSLTSGTSFTGTLSGTTLSAIINVSATVANSTCTLTLAATDHPTLTQSVSLTSPAGIVISIGDKRRGGN